jgi:hypothetical protein
LALEARRHHSSLRLNNLQPTTSWKSTDVAPFV